MAPRALLLLAAILATACHDDADESGPAASTFATINARVLEPSCTFACHSGGEFAAGGLDLEDDAYAVLVGVAPTAALCAGSPLLRVAAGDPESSLLWLKVVAKIDGSAPPCGEVMPPGADRPPITDEDADRIRAWIEAGAPAD